MNRYFSLPLSWICCICLLSCTPRADRDTSGENVHEDSLIRKDTATTENVLPENKKTASEAIHIEKEFLYDLYTLADTYPYRDTIRLFQWEKIKERLAYLENIQLESKRWMVLQNYKNQNGEAPLVKKFRRNAYTRVADTLGVERYQSIPLYLTTDTIVPERYARDGEPVEYLSREGTFVKIVSTANQDTWLIPQKYTKLLEDTVFFSKAIFVDRKNQNITTLERKEKAQWTVRSMNPATTGRYLPPYAQKTPLGMFLLQEKKRKMVYLKDGSKEVGGYAAFASRFTCGAYIHGVPVNTPRTAPIEYSPSLGTTPRSHMCVRNATSHAEFVYNWASTYETVVFVLE